MDRNGLRLINLIKYLDSKYGGKSEAISKGVVSKQYMYLLNKGIRTFGERAAKNLAEKEGLPVDYFEPKNELTVEGLSESSVRMAVHYVIMKGRATGELEDWSAKDIADKILDLSKLDEATIQLLR